MRKGICYAYQLVVNQTIGVLLNERGYDKKRAIRETLEFLEKNKITIIKEENIYTKKERLFLMT